ncbi:branched-chain amino acid ABC transporter ATP-binding protein/permease [Jiangella ureilytica]|uniref:Branched-chain amino acid ABC transporter ATP-binding protein/permease n=1 Tax=Jiangella ureilytica TaxID=2530374 RepID=A0A4R4RK98_9ACTN|nr:branched-chain amino acid ABC transporter ATP-binding protein/permease [Jiangella ureilytica]TDC49409.1 branched-chain amino acid ABC transporter ATP-binding protein/permease [Jiangella ureilytica]
MMARGLGGFVLAFAALAALAVWREDLGLPIFYLVLASTALFWIAQATSWNVLSGYSGYFSFGQGAFVGVGAYTTAVLGGRHGVDFYLTVPVAAVFSALLALLVGGLAFRLRSFRGEIFALLTLAVPFILAALARVNSEIDGGQGVVVPVAEYPEWLAQFQDFLYLLNLVVAVAAVAAAFAIQHTRFGWALASIRDAEDVAEGLGVATFRYKMLAIAVTGLIGGAAGSLFALQIGFVTVESVFGLTIPLFVIVMSVLGGRAHWLGPVLGAVVIVLIQDRLSASGFEGWNLIVLGAILAVLVVVAPDGLQARLWRRPWQAAVALVAVTGVLAIVDGWGGPLDWFVAGVLAAVAVVLWPGKAPAPAERRPAPSAAVPVPTDVDRGEAAESSGHSGPQLRPNSTIDGEVGEVLVECRDVTRYFGGVRALDGVSLQIRAGELVGLVGPNGSGKTTLVNLLSGALRPTSGSIAVAGRDIVGLAPHRIAHVGVSRTHQIPKPFESMTVRDNVAMAIMFGRSARPLAAAREEAQACLDVVHLRHLADAKPAEINLHERQLLEMARAIATKPKVLLLDEALAGLNPAEIDAAVAVVRRIHATGITIVIVEHLLRVVNQLATRVVVLNQGALLADGDPRTVMNDPDVIRAYLGRHAHARGT